MLREAVNQVKIEGILSETDLKYGSFVKDGKTVETIGGSIKVLVVQNINGAPQSNEIPVYMFSQKYTKAGKLNPAYESIERVMKEYVSIASAGGEAGATKIRITNAKITMNEYIGQNGKLVSFPRIQASFAGIANGEFKPEGSFSVEMAVSNIVPVVDSEGVEVEPRRLKITGIVPQYGGKVDVVEFLATTPNVINAIENYWEKNGTFKAVGKLNFTSTTRVEKEEVDFGEPVEHIRTVSVSELIITGGSQAPLEGEFAFDIDEINEGLARRKENLAKSKERAAAGKKTPAPTPTRSISTEDLGF